MSRQDPSTDDTVRELLLLMPRLVGRVKRLPVPERLRSMELAPRHLSLLSYLVFDGPLSIGELAERLNVASTTVSLVVADLARKGILVRSQDPADRRRHLIDIDPASRSAVSDWLSPGARAWQQALQPLTPRQRRSFIRTLHAYEAALNAGTGRGDDPE